MTHQSDEPDDTLAAVSGEVTADEVALLRGMLEIPSLSGHERPLAEYLCAEMERRGLHAHIDAAGNAVGEIRPRGMEGAEGVEKATGIEGADEAGPVVVLLGHMDTAPGEVPVRVEGDLLYGRGAVDAKGPLAAFICAAARVRDVTPLRVAVVGAVEEESATSAGARHIATRYRPAACVIGEPSRWDRVTLGYKGRMLVDYVLRQDAAHTAGSVPSAAERAVAFWNGVARVAAESSGSSSATPPSAFERVSPALRYIHGESDGLVDEARLTVSLRLPPGCNVDRLRERIEALAGEARLTVSGLEHPYRADKNNALVRAFLAAIRAQGGKPAFALKTGTSDMNVVGPVWRCPILAYGPGDSSLDHTPHEHLDLGEYGRAIAVLEQVLRGF